MSNEVEAALAGIKSAWKNILTAKDKDTFDAWCNEQKRLEKILQQEKRKLYIHFRNTSEEYRAYRKMCGIKYKRPGRPRKYNSLAEKQIELKKYNHEYYLIVTKRKRAEKRKNELPR